MIHIIFIMPSSLPRKLESPLSYYPVSYVEARERFLAAGELSQSTMVEWPISAKGPGGASLTISAGRWGSPTATRWLILSSGLHGSEAPFGSAIQLKLLQELSKMEPDDDRGILFLHALNPFGYAWIRRANENNVDLNRNFLLPAEQYQGAHPLYSHVYKAFDPHRSRGLMNNFYLQAWWLIARHTRSALQCSLPVGQYDFPKGLFFGGSGPSETLQILRQQLHGLLPAAQSITHLDFHTGLGKWAEYKLLVDLPEAHPDSQWLRSVSVPGAVESAANNRTAYEARGSVGPWMKQVLFPHANYRYAAAEFGTYGGVRVLHSLVKELQAHYADEPAHWRYQQAKRRIQETFVPSSPFWRQRCLDEGVELCMKAYHAS